MARSSRVSQAAGQIAPEDVGSEKAARGTSASRTSSTNSVSRRMAHSNGEELELLDSQEATRLANEAQENVFLFVPNLIGSYGQVGHARTISEEMRADTVSWLDDPQDTHASSWLPFLCTT